MEKCLIVAIGEHREIGIQGNLPWHIKGDLQYFKKVTMGCPVIMGRTTWQSLPFKPLPGRKNIVLSHKAQEIDGACICHSLQEAYSVSEDAQRCFIMGGASVYREAIEDMDTLYITQIAATATDADAFFVDIDPEKWFTASVSPLHKDETTGIEYRFIIYRRR